MKKNGGTLINCRKTYFLCCHLYKAYQYKMFFMLKNIYVSMNMYVNVIIHIYE